MNERDIDEVRQACDRIIDGVGGVFVGNRLLLCKLIAATLANGRVLFEDYPGSGKTLLAKVFSRAHRERHQARAVHSGPSALRHPGRQRLATE